MLAGWEPTGGGQRREDGLGTGPCGSVLRDVLDQLKAQAAPDIGSVDVAPGDPVSGGIENDLATTMPAEWPEDYDA